MSECKLCGSTSPLTFGQFLKVLRLEDISECGRPVIRPAGENLKLYRAYQEAAFAQAEKDRTATADDIEQLKVKRDGCESANVLLHADICLLHQQLDAAQADVARLREALWHAMQCWEYDGVSDEHGAVAAECSARLEATEKSAAFIKLKQAEAIERVARECGIKQATDESYCYVPALLAEAQHLRGGGWTVESGRPPLFFLRPAIVLKENKTYS